MNYKDKIRELLYVDVFDRDAITFENESAIFSGMNSRNIEDLPSVDEAWDEAYKIIESQLTEDDIKNYIEIAEKVVPVLNSAFEHFHELRLVFDLEPKGTLQ